jgi:hypothetical protein
LVHFSTQNEELLNLEPWNAGIEISEISQNAKGAVGAWCAHCVRTEFGSRPLCFERDVERAEPLDFARLHRLHNVGACFVTWLKAGIRFYVSGSRPVDKGDGLRCDQTIKLNSRKGRKDYRGPLRRVSYVVPENGQALVFLTNSFEIGAWLVARIYRRRWGIELF